MQQIRPFVSFNYDLRKPLTPSQQRKVKRYYDEIKALTNRPYQVYRPRKKQNLQPAQEFAQHEERLPALRVAFIPTDGRNKVRLRISRSSKGIRRVRGSSRHITSEIVSLSVPGLLGDTASYVARRIAGHTAKQFTIQAGRYEIPIAYLPESVPRAVARLVMRYGQETDPRGKPNNHYFANWLHGVRAYYFEKQGTLGEYLDDKQRAIKAAKKQRRRERDKRRKAARKG